MVDRATSLRLLIFAAVVATAGCDIFGPEDAEPITRLPRALTVAEASVIESGTTFGLDLFRTVAASDDRANIILSPFSASIALGMTLNGADGATFDAMRTTLGLSTLSQEEINASYSGLIDLLTTLDPEVRFDVANAVWANQNIPFHSAFLQAVADAFAASTESRDFADPATLAAINDWVDDSTNGLIDEILESLDPDLVMLLVNAIYFEGAWTTEFDPDDTTLGDFARDDGTTVQVPMMSLRDVEVQTGGGPGFSAIELPYGGEAFSMVVVLPDFGSSTRDFLAGLDEQRWNEVLASLGPRELDLLSMPKFTLSFDTYLNDALQGMGMDVAFRPGADFTRMSPLGDQMCIDFVRQKSYMEVDEEGTRAAAVTSVGVGLVSFNGVIVDRPFILAIRERLTGALLFVGLVGDPTADDAGADPFESSCT